MFPFLYRSVPTALVALLLLSSCTKNKSNGGTGADSSKGTSKIIVDTYLDSVGAQLLTSPGNLVLDGNGTLYAAQNGGIYRIDPLTHTASLFVDGTRITFPECMWYNDGLIYTGDVGTGKALSIDMTGNVSQIQYSNPDNLSFGALGVVKDQAGNFIVADLGAMYEISAETMVLSQIGIGGTGKATDGSYQSATFGEISAITVDAGGNVYIADSHTIRKLDGSTVTTISGSGALGTDDGPAKTATYGGALTICPSDDGGLYVADYYGNRVRKMNADGSVITIAGMDKQGYVDGPADIAEFYQPSGIVYSAAGHGVLYVSDYTNHTIRRITFP